MSIAVQRTTTETGSADFQVALEQVLGAGEEQEGGAGQTMSRCGHCGCGHCGCGHCGCGHCGCGHCGCGRCGHCGCR